MLLHELGHALTAKRFGLATRQITLLPIGGIASLDRLPEDPFQGLWIALAGPAVNLIIALGLLTILLVGGEWTPLERISLTDGSFLERLMLMNISPLVFNMLPAFPWTAAGRYVQFLPRVWMAYGQRRFQPGSGREWPCSSASSDD